MRVFRQTYRTAFGYFSSPSVFGLRSGPFRAWSSVRIHLYSSRTRRDSSLAFTSGALRSSSMIPFFSNLFSSSSSSNKMSYPDSRTEGEWKAVLSPEQFKILRQKGTEPAGTGKYDKHSPTAGAYECAGCGAPLYKAAQKFASGCGWPAYFDSLPGAVTRHEDRSFGTVRTEIVCSNCGGHLGHVFKGEGFPTPTDERHCVNSVSINFTEDEGKSQGK